MTIEELLQSEDISKVVSELRNGRLSVEPNTKEHVAHVALELVSKSGIEALTSRSTTRCCTI